MDALNHFYFVGLQEAYEVSVELLFRMMNLPRESFSPIAKERDQSQSKAVIASKAELKQNTALLQRTKEINHYDSKLYEQGLFLVTVFFAIVICHAGVKLFCSNIVKYPDLLDRLHKSSSIRCS